MELINKYSGSTKELIINDYENHRKKLREEAYSEHMKGRKVNRDEYFANYKINKLSCRFWHKSKSMTKRFKPG